mmetsp:Transcript_19389/g.26822  ORF Transcript_19389/g.26822 Transcript_19389/m.26822 type:complete len:124 (-) Transcript_19389:68-439(-)
MLSVPTSLDPPRLLFHKCASSELQNRMQYQHLPKPSIKQVYPLPRPPTAHKLFHERLYQYPSTLPNRLRLAMPLPVPVMLQQRAVRRYTSKHGVKDFSPEMDIKELKPVQQFEGKSWRVLERI